MPESTETPFYGRQRELAELESLLQRPGAKLVVLKGRRHVGKTALVKEFARRHPELAFCQLTGLPPSELPATQMLPHVVGELSRHFDVPRLAQEGWDELLSIIALRMGDGHAILLVDEINWLARSDRRLAARLWAAWQSMLSPLPHFMLIVCGSLGGWIDKHFVSLAGSHITKNITLDELPAHEALQFFYKPYNTITFPNQLQLLKFMGGIPRYVEEIDPRSDYLRTVDHMLFSKEGFLYDEYNRLMQDLFPSKGWPRRIIRALSEGPLTLDDLGRRLGEHARQALPEQLEHLEKAGLLMRYHTWSLYTGRVSSRYKIRIIDNYTWFFQRAIRLMRRRQSLDSLQWAAKFESIPTVQLQNFFLKNRRLLLLAIGLTFGELIREGPYFTEATAEHGGCDIDYMVHTRRALYIVEVRHQLTPITREVIDQVRSKINAIDVPRGMAVRPILLQCGGVDESVKNARYFDKILADHELVANAITFAKVLPAQTH